MSVNWNDIAKDNKAIEIGLNIIKQNRGNSLFFDELMTRAKSLGFDEKESFKFISLLISVVGGSQIYLPKEESFKKLIVFRLVYADFTGDNVSELSKKYDLSAQAIFRIVKACRAADKESRKAMEGVK
ncbi:Mor transcription activator family protein [Shewanella khirikhana]|uniref:Mor transcription activator family protein n=1 Tax=Shewanella khirikhana TaxID=1965282 RepID=A0ABM7D1F1_9GAMM|nr:Mor transcription activator family protein [Shewanella khirikhana]AZQ10122.1 Mor transcription activator family protein [Shewanella khirikhana]